MVGATLQLSIVSDIGATNQILTLTDIAQTNWVVLTNIVAVQGSCVFTDTVSSPGPQRFYRVAELTGTGTTNSPTPQGMALIPAGVFQMGDDFYEGAQYELPIHTVYISAFYMDKYEVTFALWNKVVAWSVTNGYAYDNPGARKATNHPVQMVSWYDAVKWCNARSEMEGLLPSYCADSNLTEVYRTGEVEPFVDWNAGYRLPTEAEWEKADRGGVDGHRASPGRIRIRFPTARQIITRATRTYIRTWTLVRLAVTIPRSSMTSCLTQARSVLSLRTVTVCTTRPATYGSGVGTTPEITPATCRPIPGGPRRAIRA